MTFRRFPSISASMACTFGTFAGHVRASHTYDLTAQFDDFAFWNILFISQ